MDECVLAISFFSRNFLSLFLFFKKKAQFVALCTLFSERADIPSFEFLRIIYNLIYNRRHAPASAFLLPKIFLTRGMSGHIAENTYTLMLMNTERTYIRYTHQIFYRFVSFNEEEKEKK